MGGRGLRFALNKEEWYPSLVDKWHLLLGHIEGSGHMECIGRLEFDFSTVVVVGWAIRIDLYTVLVTGQDELIHSSRAVVG